MHKSQLIVSDGLDSRTRSEKMSWFKKVWHPKPQETLQSQTQNLETQQLIKAVEDNHCLIQNYRLEMLLQKSIKNSGNFSRIA